MFQSRLMTHPHSLHLAQIHCDSCRQQSLPSGTIISSTSFIIYFSRWSRLGLVVGDGTNLPLTQLSWWRRRINSMEFVRGGRVTTNYSLLRRGHYLIKSWFDFLREKSVSVSVPEADGPRNSFASANEWGRTGRWWTSQASKLTNHPLTHYDHGANGEWGEWDNGYERSVLSFQVNSTVNMEWKAYHSLRQRRSGGGDKWMTLTSC